MQTINLEITGFVSPIASQQGEFHYRIMPQNGGMKWGELEITAVHDSPVLWVYGDLFQDQGNVSFRDSIHKEPEVKTFYYHLTGSEYIPTVVHKEEMGHRFEIGGLKLLGELLDNKPDVFISFDEMVKNIQDADPILLDHTHGLGTIWEQIAKSRNDVQSNPNH